MKGRGKWKAWVVGREVHTSAVAAAAAARLRNLCVCVCVCLLPEGAAALFSGCASLLVGDCIVIVVAVYVPSSSLVLRLVDVFYVCLLFHSLIVGLW